MKFSENWQKDIINFARISKINGADYKAFYQDSLLLIPDDVYQEEYDNVGTLVKLINKIMPEREYQKLPTSENK